MSFVATYTNIGLFFVMARSYEVCVLLNLAHLTATEAHHRQGKDDIIGGVMSSRASFTVWDRNQNRDCAPIADSGYSARAVIFRVTPLPDVDTDVSDIHFRCKTET